MTRKGYKKKPKYIYFLGIFYFIVPLITLYQFYQNVDYSFKLLREIIFSQFYLSEIFFSFTAGIAILTVRRIGFFYFIALSIYTIAIKIYNLQYNSLFEYPLDFIVILFWFTTTILFVFTAMRIPYLNPKTRWWKQPPRYSHKMPGILMVNTIKLPVIVLNFSTGGVFLKLDEERIKKDISLKNNLSYFPQHMNQIVDLEINVISEARKILEKLKFFSRAKVVWRTKEDSPYKYGLGLQFINQSNETKKQLRRYARLLKSLGFKLER